LHQQKKKVLQKGGGKKVAGSPMEVSKVGRKMIGPAGRVRKETWVVDGGEFYLS